MGGATNAESIKKHVTITRVFDAPRDAVFAAWTDPAAIKEWWGPAEFTNERVEWDPRPGGSFRIDMRGPKGTPFDAIFPTTGVFEEVVPPSRLVFTENAFFGDDPNPGIEARTTVTLEEQGARTKVTIDTVVVRFRPEFAEALAGMEPGWNQQLDKLAAYLAHR